MFEESPESAEKKARRVRDSRSEGEAEAAGLGAPLEKRQLEKYPGRSKERAEETRFPSRSRETGPSSQFR